MEVKFLKDFRGKETGEVFYPAGSVAPVKDHHAERLITLGFAEAFEPVMPVQIEAEPEAKPVQPFEVEEKPKPAAKTKAKK